LPTLSQIITSYFIATIPFKLPSSFSGHGYIPTSSLREILAALDEQLTPDQLDEMIEEIDTDASGTVDFDGEFDER
jgi:Ca2+-binding protein (EF-Hand superfamily)